MYNKLFTQILDSSIWLEPVTTRIVWITLIAAMDEDGYAHFSAVENLASRARVTAEECNAAVTLLSSPDKDSGDPDNDGRRIDRVPGGFVVLNAAKYRAKLNRATIREQTRLRVAKHRKKNSSVTSALLTVTPAIATDTAIVPQGELEGVHPVVTAEAIYGAYPLKVKKPKAIEAIRRAMLKIDPARLLELTKAYTAARNGEMAFVPHPATWFNAEQFNDAPETWKPNTYGRNNPAPKINRRNSVMCKTVQWSDTQPKPE